MLEALDGDLVEILSGATQEDFIEIMSSDMAKRVLHERYTVAIGSILAVKRTGPAYWDGTHYWLGNIIYVPKRFARVVFTK